MRKITLISMFALSGLAMALIGCGNSERHGFDLRKNHNIVMRIPYDTIEAKTFLVMETKDGYYKLENKPYTGDLVINALEKKPFIIRKGICLRLLRPSKDQKAFVDALASMCIERNLNLFVDEPGGSYVTQDSDDVDWIIRRDMGR